MRRACGKCARAAGAAAPGTSILRCARHQGRKAAGWSASRVSYARQLPECGAACASDCNLAHCCSPGACRPPSPLLLEGASTRQHFSVAPGQRSGTLSLPLSCPLVYMRCWQPNKSPCHRCTGSRYLRWPKQVPPDRPCVTDGSVRGCDVCSAPSVLPVCCRRSPLRPCPWPVWSGGGKPNRQRTIGAKRQPDPTKPRLGAVGPPSALSRCTSHAS